MGKEKVNLSRVTKDFPNHKGLELLNEYISVLWPNNTQNHFTKLAALKGMKILYVTCLKHETINGNLMKIVKNLAI